MKFLNWIKSSGKKDYTKVPNESSAQEIVQLKTGIYESLLNNEIPLTDEFELKESYLSVNKYFRENQILFCLGSKIHGSGLIYIKPSFAGRIEKLFIKPGDRIPFNSNLFAFTRIDNNEILNQKIFEQNKSLLQKTEVFYQEDDFTGDKTIKVTKVSSEDTPYFKLYRDQTELAHDFLGLTFINHNGHLYLSFNSRNEDIALTKSDSLIFLFEDRTKLEFVFNTVNEGSKGCSYNHIAIGFEELNTFLSKNLWKVKMISHQKNLYCIYHMKQNINENVNLFSYQKAQYSSEQEGQYLLRYLTGRFIEMNQNYKT